MNRQRLNVITTLAGIGVCLGMLDLSWSEYWPWSDVNQARKSIPVELREDLKQWRGTWSGRDEQGRLLQAPTQQFFGEDLRIVLTSQPGWVTTGSVDAPRRGFWRQQVLARDRSGQQLLLTYVFRLDEPAVCRRALDCGFFDTRGFAVLSDRDAKVWVLQHGEFDAADYKRVFGEEPPPPDPRTWLDRYIGW